MTQPAPRLLLISNSTMHGGGYLQHAAAEIRDFLGNIAGDAHRPSGRSGPPDVGPPTGAARDDDPAALTRSRSVAQREASRGYGPKRVAFVPWALANHDEYAAKAARAFAAFGHELFSLHTTADPVAALDGADAVFVGGGNTFRLLARLHATHLLPAIQRRVRAGMPYIGSSAGTNVATPSIRTTNDMPIVMPPSFAALALVPFQINPHYLDPDPRSTHMGETREERIRQFHEENEAPVLGLREGCMLRVEGERMELRGTTGARLFRRGAAAEEFTPPCDLSFLLRTPTS